MTPSVTMMKLVGGSAFTALKNAKQTNTSNILVLNIQQAVKLAFLFEKTGKTIRLLFLLGGLNVSNWGVVC
jgi:hypothetical protein